MTTFKWTEVAIKVSGLELKLADAEREANDLRYALNNVSRAVTSTAEQNSLNKVLVNYRTISGIEPTPEQVNNFKQALEKSSVTVVPLDALSGVIKLEQPKNK